MNILHNQKTNYQNKTAPLENLVLSPYEQKVEAALDQGKFVSVSNLKKSKKLFKEAAKEYHSLHKSKPITIRIKQKDLLKVKTKAKRNAIPYQTLLGVLTHQYAEGKIQLQL